MKRMEGCGVGRGGNGPTQVLIWVKGRRIQEFPECQEMFVSLSEMNDVWLCLVTKQ